MGERGKDRFNPWRRIRDLGDDWDLIWTDRLPDDVYGYTCHRTRRIVMRSGMTQAERRCTAAHEAEHAWRGPTSNCRLLGEELRVNRKCARLLVPAVTDLADALVWHHGNYEAAADELWVDVWTLEVRLASLDPRENAYLSRRLSEVTLLAAGH